MDKAVNSRLLYQLSYRGLENFILPQVIRPGKYAAWRWRWWAGGLGAAHAGSTAVAQVAVAVADGDRAANVAYGGVGLELGELFA